MWYRYTMEFHKAIENNEITAFARKQTEQENIITLSETSQTQRVKGQMFSP